MSYIAESIAENVTTNVNLETLVTMGNVHLSAAQALQSVVMFAWTSSWIKPIVVDVVSSVNLARFVLQEPAVISAQED